jgi:hypothetical protein
MYKYFLTLLILICLIQPAAALNEKDGFTFTKLRFNPFKLNSKDVKTTKLAKDVTLKVNKDLFTKGVVLRAKTYGKYYANLDVSNLFDLRHRSTMQDKFSSFQKRNSVITGALKVGQVVSKESRLFLRLGFESKNLAKSNTLKTPHLTTASQGFWKTAIEPGVGIEHTFANKLAVTGEVRANLATDLMGLSERTESRHGMLHLGLKYFIGEK